MANKVAVGFAFKFQGDGSSTSVQCNLVTNPVYFSVPSADYPTLSPTANATPSSVSDVSTSGGLTVSTTSVTLGVLTVNFTSAPANGTIYTVFGYLEY